MTDSIWYSEPLLTELNDIHKDTVCEVLGIHITEVGPDFLRGTMPADARTFQPFGLIHGGSNVVLAETLGSVGANWVVDNKKFFCVGQEVNANHLRGVRDGIVTGTARLVHKGRTSQVWEIHIVDDKQRLSCISRLTMAVVAVS
jgi:1,4-dihydroxy-2-naphthoyl-CoA hydrolase